ncbi:hypothetical protein NQ315_008728 [Exocentrus adspersus]|uniref:Uncharacterized protein n=1 Tax=Exocentrus adspersus TaxID=1586481 RepID=A0AAV8W7I5_9CUCU|nr:hypothetical protein NQ315_008728 [Exocentrus adspersus]
MVAASYIIPCSMTNNFNECALKNGQYAIPFLIKGDRSLKIPNMNPLKVPLVELNGTNSIHLKLKDAKVYGLEKLKILNVSTDFDKRQARIISSLDRIDILADYEINGRMLIFAITGHGPLNLTMYNGTYQYDVEWDLVSRDGKVYFNITNSKYDYAVGKITYEFKNLFNGDKLLGRQMNKFLNENWELVNDDLKGAFLQILLVFHDDISRKIYSQIPYDELFLA